jgi:septum formation protein
VLILASGSEVRAQMLQQAGVAFTVVVPPQDAEDAAKDLCVSQGIFGNARALALAVAKGRAVSAQHPEAWVVAADQMCMVGEEVLSKPRTAERACLQLAQLAGRTHHQISAVCVVRAGEVLWQHLGVAALTMRALSTQEIADYVALDRPLASCGSYMYERHGKQLFAQVDGDEDVILGMPLAALRDALPLLMPSA